MKCENLIKTIVLCGTLLCCSVILAMGLSKVMHTNRTVTVRGLAEKEVDADMAVWKLTYSVGENSLANLQKKIVEGNEAVTAYLVSCGLEDADFSILSPDITDSTVNIYIDQSKNLYKYVAKQTFLIRTSKVPVVKYAYDNTLELVGKGISVTSDYDTKVNYYFTKLNEIKPQMIAEATKNAREAANQFAADSNSKVGKIQTASQGLFSIDDAAAGMEYKKQVRVVTSVVYSLVD